MARRIDQQYVVSAPPELVADHLLRVIGSIPKITNVHHNPPYVSGETKAGMTSWGEHIVAHLTVVPGGTHVDVSSKSALPTQFIDWGRNRKNVEAIIAGLRDLG